MTTLEARLQRLEDRDAIHQLFIEGLGERSR